MKNQVLKDLTIYLVSSIILDKTNNASEAKQMIKDSVTHCNAFIQGSLEYSLIDILEKGDDLEAIDEMLTIAKDTVEAKTFMSEILDQSHTAIKDYYISQAEEAIEENKQASIQIENEEESDEELLELIAPKRKRGRPRKVA
jgi:hypothetical protein